MACYWILLQYICVAFSIRYDMENRFAIKVNISHKENIKNTLEEYSFFWTDEISESTSVIEYKGYGRGLNILKILASMYPNQIVWWEPVREYVNEIKPAQAHFPSKPPLPSKKGPNPSSEDVLKYGDTCKGISIAVSDVGYNTDLSDIEMNIKRILVHQNTKFSPKPLEDDNNLRNEVASTIAPKTGCPVGNASIASTALIAALKIYEVQLKMNQSEVQTSNWTALDIMSRQLVYKLDEIDIFVNSWSQALPFEPRDSPMQEAIEYGAREGRQGLGTIYVVPAGSAGNGLSNNIHTITVGSIDRFGSLPFNANIAVDASVITSVISDAINFASSTIIAATYKTKCISRFKELSEATTKVAAIIALGIEANPNLTSRNVVHLLVQASDHRGLLQKSAFKQNGAGKMFHSVLGFGLLDQSKLVDLARNKVLQTPTLLSSGPIFETERQNNSRSWNVKFLHSCANNTKGDCVTVVEQVHVSLKLNTNTTNLKAVIISPAGTESVLINEKQLSGLINGQLVTSHFWDELSEGVWKIRTNIEQGTFLQIENVSITIFGTYRPVKAPAVVNDDVSTNPVHVNEAKININIIIAIIITIIIVIVVLVIAIKWFIHKRKEKKIRKNRNSERKRKQKQKRKKQNTMI